MTKSKNVIHSLDINRSNICYTQYLKEDKVISNIGIQPLDKDTKNYWDCVKNGLDELLKKTALPSGTLICSLPGECALIKKIQVDASETDVESVIHWELSQQVMSPLEEFSIDYQHLTNYSTADYMHYLVVAYRNNAIEQFTKILKQKKLVPTIIDLDIFALINIFETNYPELVSLPTFIIYSEGLLTKIILTQHGNFIDVECIEHGSESMSILTYQEKINTSIELLNKYNQRDSQQYSCLFSGSFFSVPEMASALKAQLENSELMQPFKNIGCGKDINPQLVSKYSPQLAVCIGLSIRESKEYS